MRFIGCVLLVLAGGAALPAQTAGKPALPVVLFTTWRDPQEGAFTLSVPKGWQVSGGASRRAAVDIRQVVRASAPGGRIQILIDDPDIVPRQVPDQMMMRMGLREGQTIRAAWGGPILLQRFRSGAEYSRDYTALKLCRQAQYTGGGEMQAETASMNREVGAYAMQSGVDARASVGDAYFRCGAELGYVTATTILARPRGGPGAQTWAVLHLSGFTVQSAADAAYAMYILHIMTASFKMDAQWEERSHKEVSALTASVTRMQNAMMANLKQQWANQAAQERASVVSKDKGFDVMAGWEARNKTMDKVFENDTEVRRGVTVTEDPIWGSRTVSNDYNYYWTRPDGSIVGTTTDTPPKLDGSQWRLMTNH
jgi:hypothetical protein